MDLDSYWEACRQTVEQALDRVLPAASAPPSVLHEAMRYSVFAGGKRIRPVLTIASAECLGGDQEQALAAASAVELLHTYTLIHDDLPCIDDDDVRRGRPSCHKAFGEANALLAGDSLLTLAFEVASHAPVAPEKIVQVLAVCAGSRGVVGGQVADLAATGNRIDNATMQFIHEHKTAALFRAAVEMGALCAGANGSDLSAMRKFGRATGLAFQLVDDLLDADDPTDHSFSCVTVMGLEAASDHAAALTTEALDALKPFGNRASTLRMLATRLLERTT